MSQPTLFQAPRTDWTTTLPNWLTATLDTINNRERREDQVHLTNCPRCHQPIFQAHDTFTWRIDPTQLNNRLELAALILKRQTFTLTIDTFKHLDITHRPPSTIRDQPANTTETFAFPGRRGPKQLYVIPEHQCHRTLGQPIPWNVLYTEPAPQIDRPPF